MSKITYISQSFKGCNSGIYEIHVYGEKGDWDTDFIFSTPAKDQGVLLKSLISSHPTSSEADGKKVARVVEKIQKIHTLISEINNEFH